MELREYLIQFWSSLQSDFDTFGDSYLDSVANGADWLLTDKVVSWSRTPAERGWNYLQQSLERHDSAQTDYRYSKTVLDTILTHEKGATIPPWLVRTLEVR
jgi:nuclear pore complex protein Nup160